MSRVVVDRFLDFESNKKRKKAIKKLQEKGIDFEITSGQRKAGVYKSGKKKGKLKPLGHTLHGGMDIFVKGGKKEEEKAIDALLEVGRVIDERDVPSKSRPGKTMNIIHSDTGYIDPVGTLRKQVGNKYPKVKRKREPQSMNTKVQETEMRNPFPRPEEEEVKKAIVEQQQAEMAQAMQEIEAVGQGTAVAQTPAGRMIASEQINKNELLNEEQKDQAKKELDNPQSIVDTYLKNKMNKEQGEKPSVKNQFMEALTFFLPNITGLAVGGLMGGAEGAVVGEQRGGALGTSLREYKMKKEELKNKGDLSPEDILKLKLSEERLKLSEDRLSFGKEKEGRVAKVQQSNLGLRKEAIEEKIEGRKLREKRFEFDKKKQEYTEIKDASQRKIRVAQDYNSDSIVRTAKEGITQAQKAKKNLERNNPISASVVVRSLARLAGEKGVMTEADVNDFRTSPAWDDQMQQLFERAVTGKLTSENKKYMSQIIGDMESIERELLDKQTNTYVSQFSSLVNEDAKAMGGRLRGDFLSSQESKLLNKFKAKYPNVSEEKLKKKILQKTRGAK